MQFGVGTNIVWVNAIIHKVSCISHSSCCCKSM